MKKTQQSSIEPIDIAGKSRAIASTMFPAAAVAGAAILANSCTARMPGHTIQKGKLALAGDVGKQLKL